jgi:hypothetical protein
MITRVSNTLPIQVLRAPEEVISNTFAVQVVRSFDTIVSNTFSVQVNSALTTVVSNTFPLQVVSGSRDIVSNTLSLNVLLPAGKQAITLGPIVSGSVLFGVASQGDEWIIDLVTSGGLAITPASNGTYSIAGLAGAGNQSFSYFYVDTSNTYSHSITSIISVDAVAATNVVSNTFALTVEVPVGKQVIALTSNGDEWVVDLLTDGGLPVVIAANGTYTVTGLQGSGNQEFTSYTLDISAGFKRINQLTHFAIDPDTLPIAPSITGQPVGASLVEGSGSITFAVTVSGRPLPSYQWYTEGLPIDGQTSSTLEVLGRFVDVADSGKSYFVRVTNSAGSIDSNSAVLTVTASAKAPVIALEPVSNTLLEGSGNTITFTASATAQNTPTVQWQVFKGSSYENIIGATSTSLSVTGTDVTYAIDNASGYRAIFTNPEGIAITDTAVLYITPIVDQAPDGILTATELTDGSFNVRFTADEAGLFKLIVVPNNQVAPSAIDVFTGNVPNILRESPTASMDVGVEVITPIVDMEVYTPYDVYAVLKDSNDNYRLLTRLDVSTLRDASPPVIILNGSANIAIPQGTPFIDQGALVTDNVDQDRQILGTGAIPYNTIGSYLRYYNTADSTGNAALTVTRRVVVYDPALYTADGGGVLSDVLTGVIVDTGDEVLD